MNNPQSQALAMLDPELAGVQLHGPEEFEGMRKAGHLAAEVLDSVSYTHLTLPTICSV